MSVPLFLRVAAILHWCIAVGFGLFCVPAIRNRLSGRDIPIVMGLPAYGRGPFERIGIPTPVPLLVAFLLVCMLEAVAGGLLWRGSMSGAVLASDFLRTAPLAAHGVDLTRDQSGLRRDAEL